MENSWIGTILGVGTFIVGTFYNNLTLLSLILSALTQSSYIRCCFRVVCVGGDGIFAELLNGILRMHNTRVGVDLEDPTEVLCRPPMRIGVIPAGKTKAIDESWLKVVEYTFKIPKFSGEWSVLGRNIWTSGA